MLVYYHFAFPLNTWIDFCTLYNIIRMCTRSGGRGRGSQDILAWKSFQLLTWVYCISPGQLQYCTQSLLSWSIGHIHNLHTLFVLLTWLLCALSSYVNRWVTIPPLSVCIEYEIPVRFSQATYTVTEGVGYVPITLEVLEVRTFSFNICISLRFGSAEGGCHVIVYGQSYSGLPINTSCT